MFLNFNTNCFLEFQEVGNIKVKIAIIFYCDRIFQSVFFQQKTFFIKIHSTREVLVFILSHEICLDSQIPFYTRTF